MTQKQTKQYNALTRKEKKIYDAIKRSFPATSHDACHDYAIQGGVKFQFYPR